MTLVCVARAEDLPRPGSFDTGPFKMEGQLNGTPCNIKIALAQKSHVDGIPNFFQVIFDRDTFGHVSGFDFTTFVSDGGTLQVNAEGQKQKVFQIVDTESGDDARLILDFDSAGQLKSAQYLKKSFGFYRAQFACGNLGKAQLLKWFLSSE